MDDQTFFRILKALSEPRRFEILERVTGMAGEDGVMCSDVLAGLRMSQSTFSHHASELREAGLLRAREAGRCSFLTPNNMVVEAFKAELARRMR